MIRSNKRVPRQIEDEPHTKQPKPVRPPLTLTWQQASFIASSIQGVLNLQGSIPAVSNDFPMDKATADTLFWRINDLKSPLEILDEILNESNAVYEYLNQANR